MGRKRHKPEEIVATLRQVEVLTTQGHRSTQRKIARTACKAKEQGEIHLAPPLGLRSQEP